ncbi:MAG TPA: helix-turn-helix transcriptional regulator [Pseudonocardiaceae bacterium]|nr:helix-turn-helix transcriptional regulator [Pseudonocardiaceae bacterium]
MTVDGAGETGDLTADRAKLASLRRDLGTQLVAYRMAAGVSQAELAHAVGRTRSTISKVEHGTRGMPARLWKITDEVCRADGALVAAYSALTDAEQDYRARGRRLRQAAYAEARVQSASSPAARYRNQDVAWQERTRVSGELAEELMAVVTKLIRSLGRRDAIRMISGTLAAVGLSAWMPTSTRG